jgi:hypothetical protein
VTTSCCLFTVLQCDYFMLSVHFEIHLLRISFLSVKYVAFTCGLIRGALSNLGINSMVTAEVHSMPACKFHIPSSDSLGLPYVGKVLSSGISFSLSVIL